MEYEVVIGLEIHTELKTKSKIFCGCTTQFGGEPNTHTCPVCLGMPGVLPVLNKEVVEYAIRTGLALNCGIAEFSKFDRKNYYYPDLPKNFQTSQFDFPICNEGHIDIMVNDSKKRIGITRIHMEEDAGKLVHSGDTISSSNSSLVDYNRTGVPLLEIVSEPDLRSPEEARIYMENLKAILEYLDVSDCKMQEGSLRCDANISLRPMGSDILGTRTETKNLNSFRSLQRAMEYEIERQKEVLEEGGKITQETRTWDDAKGITLSLRSKEEAHDYRYFPEPDLLPMIIERAWVDKAKALLPELPEAKKARLVAQCDLSEYDASVITTSKALADYFEETISLYNNPKVVSNWLMGDFSRLINANDMEIADVKVSSQDFAGLLKLIDNATVSGKIAKTVFEEMFETGKSPDVIVKEKGLVQITDEGAILQIVQKVVAANPQSVEDFINGKERAIGFLVGQVMKESKGKANPGLVNKLLVEVIQK